MVCPIIVKTLWLEVGYIHIWGFQLRKKEMDEEGGEEGMFNGEGERKRERKKETNKERKEGRRFRGWILATSAKGIVTGEKPREKREGKKIADNLVQNIMHWHGTLLHTWNYSIYNKCHICAQRALTEMANTWRLD